MGVTTPTQGKQRDNNEGHRKDEYYLLGAEPAIRQQLALLEQKDLHAAAAHAEAKEGATAEAARIIMAAKAEADRVIMAAKAEAERVTMAAARTRAESERSS